MQRTFTFERGGGNCRDWYLKMYEFNVYSKYLYHCYLNYCTDFDNKAVILHELLASLFLDLSELNMETTSTLSLSREIHKEDGMDFTQKSGMRSV